MISKLLAIIFNVIQNQDQSVAIDEMTRIKMHNLSNLITFLTITLFIIIFLLIVNLYKNYKLKTEINYLKSQ